MHKHLKIIFSIHKDLDILLFFINYMKTKLYFYLTPHVRMDLWLVSASHTVGLGFAPRLGHTKDHHKNVTNCLSAWHPGI